MSATGLEQFDKALQSTNIWLGEIMRGLGSDRHAAWSVLGAVLHTLRDRLTNEQVAHLGSQLPLLIRGLFYEQWHPVNAPAKLRKAEDFLAAVSERLKIKHPIDIRQAVQIVFSVLSNHPRGEIQKIIKTLSPGLQALTTAELPELAAQSAFAWE